MFEAFSVRERHQSVGGHFTTTQPASAAFAALVRLLPMLTLPQAQRHLVCQRELESDWRALTLLAGVAVRSRQVTVALSWLSSAREAALVEGSSIGRELVSSILAQLHESEGTAVLAEQSRQSAYAAWLQNLEESDWRPAFCETPLGAGQGQADWIWLILGWALHEEARSACERQDWRTAAERWDQAAGVASLCNEEPLTTRWSRASQRLHRLLRAVSGGREWN